jgi:DNA-binding transcriptional LysR family regulator
MPLWSERILLALLEGHPLADKDVVYWTDLRGETLLHHRSDRYHPGYPNDESVLRQ